MQKLLPPQFFILTAILMGVICASLGSTHYVPYPFNLSGIVLIFGGIIFAQMGKKVFIRESTTVNTFDRPVKLITSGIFGVTRNPMYLGFMVAIVGFTLLYQGSLSSWILSFLFFIVLNTWYIRFEEKMMKEQFGEEYNSYCQKTRRWI